MNGLSRQLSSFLLTPAVVFYFLFRLYHLILSEDHLILSEDHCRTGIRQLVGHGKNLQSIVDFLLLGLGLGLGLAQVQFVGYFGGLALEKLVGYFASNAF